MDTQQELLERLKIRNAIIVGVGALVFNGFTNLYGNFVELLAKSKEIDNIRMGWVKYTFLDNFDTSNYMVSVNDKILVPTPERSIIDCIRYSDSCQEEHLYCALVDYKAMYPNLDKLYEVANFYSISRNKIDELIEEAELDGE